MSASMSVATMKAMRPLVTEAVRETIRDIDIHTRSASMEERERLTFISRSMQNSLKSAEAALESHIALKNISDQYSHDDTLCQALRAISKSQTQIVSNNVQHLYDSASLYESDYSPGSSRLLEPNSRSLRASMRTYQSSLTMGSMGISDHLSSLFSDDLEESEPVVRQEGVAGAVHSEVSAELDDFAAASAAGAAASAKDALNKRDHAPPAAVSDWRTRKEEAYTARFSDEVVTTTTVIEGEKVESSQPQRSGFGDYAPTDYAWRSRILQNALYVAQFATAILILIRNSSSMTAGMGASVSESEVSSSTPKGGDSGSGRITKGGPTGGSSGMRSP